MRWTVRVVLPVLGAILVLPGTASALKLKPCSGPKGFGCGTLTVPLDRSGALPGSLHLRIAAQDSTAARKRKGLLVALTGGPGQEGVPFASSFASTLRPLLGHYRLVTLDQRGTGASGALNCTAIQKLSSLDPFTPAAVAACAAKIGDARRAYTTQDTVADLEALRIAFKAPKLALMGVSYGTYVAQQYARVHPATTDRLVLDSVVAPGGVDPFLLDTFSRLPRVLKEQCDDNACRGATTDPVGDVGTLVGKLAGSGSISGKVYNASGKPGTATFSTGEQLVFAIISGDLNPYLQAALPGAINAATRGDTAPLARLRRIAAEAPTPRKQLSGALNVVTGCEDNRLPFSLDTPLTDRPAIAAAALAALPASAYTPFDADTVRTAGYVDDCLDFPGPAAGEPPLPVPADAPLPNVPTLLLSGRLDTRTPLENAEQLQASDPAAQRLTVPGTGHDETDSDQTGCVRRALVRFAANHAVGDPCAGQSNQVAPFPRPPSGLSSFSPVGAGGQAGRVLAASLDTLSDARVSVLETLYAGLSSNGGGLRGGSYRLTGESGLSLKGYAYVNGVALTGHVDLRGGAFVGNVSVRAGSQSGALRLSARSVSGRLGGKAVSFRAGSATAASLEAPTLWSRTRGLRFRDPPAGLTTLG